MRSIIVLEITLLLSWTETQARVPSPYHLADDPQITTDISPAELLATKSPNTLCLKDISFFGFRNLFSLRAIHVQITHLLS